MRLLWALAFATGILGCTNIQRSPSSEMFDGDRVTRIQEIDLELSTYWNNNWKLNQKAFQTLPPEQYAQNLYKSQINDDPVLQRRIQELVNERHGHTQSLAHKLQLRDWSGIGPWFSATFRPTQTQQTDTLSIRSWDEYRIGSPPRPAFPLEHNLYSNYSLRLNNMLMPQLNVHNEKNAAQRYLKARLQCNADIISHGQILFFSKENRSPIYDFNWYYNRYNGQELNVKFTGAVNDCTLSYFDPETDSAWTHSMQLKSLSHYSQEWVRLTNHIEVCPTPRGAFSNSLQNFFWQQDYSYMTCPYELSKTINLRDPYEAINQKILNLTGAPLNKKDFEAQNPMTKLNFSKAPNFDFIFFSSLNFSADFSGMVTSQALRFHAEKGTQIRIFLSEATVSKKDKDLLQRLQAGTPNIKIQYFKYLLSNGDNGTWIDKFHRVNHTKVLLGYSTQTPDKSFFYTGGRNLRDSYFFRDAPAYKAYKFLKNYRAGEESYIFYDDFEMEVRGHDFVRSAASQMLALWMRDPITHRQRSTNINIPREANASEIQNLEKISEEKVIARHLVAVPFVDNFQLEKFYIELIDTARKELILTTPYFRPSVAISAALDRAAKRGVTLKVLTRIHLAGDGTPAIAEDVNKSGINRHLKDVAIYEWTDPDSIMHAKLLIIDKELSFVSSVNLNRRSFIHDIENGLLIINKKTALSLREEALNFFRESRRIEQEEKISWINSTLIDWADSYF